MYEFPVVHRWTPEALVGLIYSTSFLPHEVLASAAADFEADLRDTLTMSDLTGSYVQTIRFAYQLARA